MNYRWFCIFAGLLLSGAGSAAETEIYRWVDEFGRVQFSDTRRSDADEPVRMATLTPTAEQIELQGRLMQQQLELIALLEDSRQSRARENLERRRQSVELARARLALEQERNAAAYQSNYNDRRFGYAYPVPYSYRYQRRHGNRYSHGHGGGSGYQPRHLPAGSPRHSPGAGGRGSNDGSSRGHAGRGGGSKSMSSPFITKGS